MSLFPDVPNLPGVPPLLRDPLAITNVVVRMTRDALRILGILPGPQWGIFLDGERALDADSVAALDYKRSSNVSDYPIEGGQFETYNKVATPFNVRVRLTKGGSDTDRADFLSRLEEVAASLDLYDVVTSTAVYRNVNINHFDYRQTATHGVGLLTVDLGLVEVRVTDGLRFSNTKTNSSKDPVNQGQVQTRDPTAAEAAQTEAVQ
jgi:hypothetical protein